MCCFCDPHWQAALQMAADSRSTKSTAQRAEATSGPEAIHGSFQLGAARCRAHAANSSCSSSATDASTHLEGGSLVFSVTWATRGEYTCMPGALNIAGVSSETTRPSCRVQAGRGHPTRQPERRWSIPPTPLFPPGPRPAPCQRGGGPSPVHPASSPAAWPPPPCSPPPHVGAHAVCVDRAGVQVANRQGGRVPLRGDGLDEQRWQRLAQTARQRVTQAAILGVPPSTCKGSSQGGTRTASSHAACRRRREEYRRPVQAPPFCWPAACLSQRPSAANPAQPGPAQPGSARPSPAWPAPPSRSDTSYPSPSSVSPCTYTPPSGAGSRARPSVGTASPGSGGRLSVTSTR